ILKGAKEERLILYDWSTRAEPIVPKSGFCLLPIAPCSGIQKLVMAVSKRTSVKLICSGFKVEHHHAAVGDAVLCRQPARLRLNFLYGLHGRANLNGIALDGRGSRSAVHSKFFGEYLCAVDHRLVGAAQRGVAGRQSEGKLLNIAA